MIFKRFFADNAGFTLIELLITLLISMIVIGSIYTAFQSQQHTYIVQDQVVEMQQNIRAALMLMVRDIRMAGYDPSGKAATGFVSNTTFSDGTGSTTTVTTAANQIAFTADHDGDGSIDQTVEDIDNNGNKDMTEMEQIAYRINGTDLERFSTNTGFIIWQDIAKNIEAIEFVYLDSLGHATTELNNIRSVKISILARSGKPDREFTNTALYCPASHPIKNLTTSPPHCEDSAGATLTSATWGPYNDNFRRR